jgi:hypothetical protein
MYGWKAEACILLKVLLLIICVDWYSGCKSSPKSSSFENIKRELGNYNYFLHIFAKEKENV